MSDSPGCECVPPTAVSLDLLPPSVVLIVLRLPAEQIICQNCTNLSNNIENLPYCTQQAYLRAVFWAVQKRHSILQRLESYNSAVVSPKSSTGHSLQEVRSRSALSGQIDWDRILPTPPASVPAYMSPREQIPTYLGRFYS